MGFNPVSAVRHAAGAAAQAVGHAVGVAARHPLNHAPVAIPSRELIGWGRIAAANTADTAATLATKAGAGVATRSRTDAILSKDVYADVPGTLPPGVRVATQADLALLNITPQMLESENFRARVYVEGSGPNAHYTVAFRGTRGMNGADWKANAEQALGQNSEHYTMALKLGQSLARFPELSISMTGHSLGGGLASAAAIAAGRDANTFNAAGLSDRTIGQAQAINAASANRRAAAVDAFYVRGDVLSLMQDGGDRVAGALIGGAIGGPLGRFVGAALINAPEAYGTRHAIGNDRPPGHHWTEELPVYRAIARHNIDYAIHNLP